MVKDPIILMVDDDEDDCLMVRDALAENHLTRGFYTVEDGEEMMDFLHRRGRHAEDPPPLPDLILLDLNMPRKDGREALGELKQNVTFCRIPVVILTTSDSEDDITRCYDLGGNAYIRKPVTFEALVEVMRAICIHWFQVVRLPPPVDQSS